MISPKPISRRDLLDLLRAQSRPLHAREIATGLSIREADYLDLLALLNELADEGAVRGLPGQRYRVGQTQPSEVLQGVISVHPNGFGFVGVPEQPQDVFVRKDCIGGAMHGDRVRIRLLARTNRGMEGAVVEVIERSNQRVQGVLQRHGRSCWLEPDDLRIRGPIVLRSDTIGQHGDGAVAAIIRFPEDADENPEGQVVECFGPAGEPRVESQKILVREGISETFPPEIEEDAQAVCCSIDPEAIEGREDLRGLPLITIDPDDARDHDDAIWVNRTEGGFDLCVAIADVAEYVHSGSALDREASARAFSLYLPDRAVPMLPVALSSVMCSLQQGVDRLCLSVRMSIDSSGQVMSTQLTEGVMRSRARLSYLEVARAMGWADDVTATTCISDDLRPHIQWADQLAQVLRRRRMQSGALDMQLPEAHFELNPLDGSPIDVRRRAEDSGVRRAYQLIEELMLAANEAVASWMVGRGLLPVFRVHPPPDESRLNRLVDLCLKLNLDFELEDALNPRGLSTFLRRTADHPLASVIATLVLRSLKQASYDIVNIGHFGLALDRYLHFTSPIRRYPDLLVHRAIKSALRANTWSPDANDSQLRDAVDLCNKRERLIMDIEREMRDLYRALVMRDKIGLEADGIVTEILPSGAIVSLDNPFADVRLRSDSLSADTFRASDDGLRLVGARSGECIQLGDRMRVRVDAVDLGRRIVLGCRCQGHHRSSKGMRQATQKRRSRPRKHATR